MNVCVAHSMLGNHAEWVSVLPSGPNGDYVANCCADLGMPVDHIRRVDDADIGVFWVLPLQKRVLYQRKYSAFWIDQVGLPSDSTAGARKCCRYCFGVELVDVFCDDCVDLE